MSAPWAYYNEHDKKAAAWLRELIELGVIAKGDVDDRDIHEVRPDDIAGYRQCHFFAGIGGWSIALRLAGWPDDEPVWTGSCPCQPFSAAGKGLGTADPRHLWPQFRRLIRKRRPATVFGEQVAGSGGRRWLSSVFADMEAIRYRAAGADLCAASVGLNIVRQRLFWVAEDASPDSLRRQGQWAQAPRAREWERVEFAGLVEREVRLSISTGQGGLLNDGVSNRVAVLRGFGNAIVPEVAAKFVQAYATRS